MSTIMIVDDMAVVREPIAASLRAAGYATLCAADGTAALSSVFEYHPDLVILDLAMPGMDGMQVLRALREKVETVRLPVVLLTASADKECILEAGRLGVRDYIVKSRFSLSGLIGVVGKYVKPGSGAPGLKAVAR